MQSLGTVYVLVTLCIVEDIANQVSVYYCATPLDPETLHCRSVAYNIESLSSLWAGREVSRTLS